MFDMISQAVLNTILKVLGSYYHFTDNFHYYERKNDFVYKLSEIDEVEDETNEYQKKLGH